MLCYQYICVFKTRRLGPLKKDATKTKTRIDRLGRFTVHRSGRFHFNATFRFFYALRRPKEITNIDPW